jgi:hypothetical protein
MEHPWAAEWILHKFFISGHDDHTCIWDRRMQVVASDLSCARRRASMVGASGCVTASLTASVESSSRCPPAGAWEAGRFHARTMRLPSPLGGFQFAARLRAAFFGRGERGEGTEVP